MTGDDFEEDPAGRDAPPSVDLHEVSEWEPRSRLDRVARFLHGFFLTLGKILLVVLAIGVLFAQLAVSGLALLSNPWVGTLTLTSAVPALGLAAIINYWDVPSSEPPSLLLATFLLAISFASLAATLNTVAQPLFEVVPVVGPALFFYLVVAPGEEVVKLAAVRVYAYTDESFNAVIDGAVYGAAAGLGFATVENLIYINREYREVIAVTGADVLPEVVGIAAVRTFAGPGHVIYTAIAGYYLGLAKYNPDDSGPIVVKGLLIAGFLHATYNSLVGFATGWLHAAAGLPLFVSFALFVVAYDAVAFYLLYRLLVKYRRAYETGPPRDPPAEADKA